MPLSFPHLVSVNQIQKSDIEALFSVAEDMEKVLQKGGSDILNDKVVALLFYEPSTRTSLSFQAACARLGASPILALGKEAASLKKGETIEDTIRMAMGYSDLIVMRHPEEGSALRAAEVSSVPFINAGDGGNEHPTQGLLDLYTIHKRFGKLENLHVVFSADPLHSRTIRSLSKLLSLFPGSELTFASPEELRISPELRELLHKRSITTREVHRLEEAIGSDTDIIYMNRLQEERFSHPEDFQRLRKAFILTAKHLKNRKAVVMSPLPRVDEIDVSVDKTKNAIYFDQARNGVPVRMALLAMMLNRA